MQKHEKASQNILHKCQICQKQPTNDCLLTDVAHYCVQTGNLMMVSRLACKPCRQQVLTIRKYVEENALSFSKNSSVFKQYIQPYLPKSSMITLPDQSEIYQKNIQQQIKRDKLYHCSKLPQNCLQLVYYSSFSINHAERHQRIRNTICEVMRIAPIPYGNLEDIATLVHCLSCYMHESNVIILLRLICERVIVEGSPITPPNLDSQLPAQRIWKQLYSKCYIGNILIIIGQMLKDWRNFDTIYQKLQSYTGYLRKQKIAPLLAPSSQISPSPKKRVSMQSPSKFDDHTNGCKQCKKNRIQYLLNQARIKNLFSLSLKFLMRQDAAQREHIVQIQAKFAKQKDQFINKIIKLKDKIQILEHKDQLQEKPFRRARSFSQYHGKKKIMRELEQISQKSEGTTKTIEGRQKQEQKQDDNVNTHQTDKPKSDTQALQYLHKLVINVPEFDPSLLSNDADQKLIVSTIQAWMKSTKEQLDKLQKKNKVLENESKRLLTILTRKQERFVPLIHQKDQIIQRYQNCLWRMQHGLTVEDPALAPRIFSIINVFKNQFLQSLSTGTLQSDITKQQMAQLYSPPTKTAKKKKENQKLREKTQKKLKNNQKQCAIF